MRTTPHQRLGLNSYENVNQNAMTCVELFESGLQKREVHALDLARA